MYQKKMMRAYDKKVRPREFHEGDLILKNILPIQKDFRGKWMPNWEGPYVVKKAFSRGALILAEMDGKNLPNPVNSDSVKKGKEAKVKTRKGCFETFSKKMMKMKNVEAKVKTRKECLETKGVLSRKPEKGGSNCNQQWGMQ
ncbi:RNA-directed DNA polymerase (Reverse transcriptase), Ribonuclease H [Gossypium australe]|uniref:RNA-directed DNA polymerase (Reverse transcriptase), Ribonuclease H n=1 Tax=Gossypium australe TaxID=47621 RepID=A0A5B6U5Y2_9ROSI|nr:RNA-directed DNA polymerase (Reverse transcriptase), Ribonuclease H [Gossypium australe]